jgi:hypothetical protein
MRRRGVRVREQTKIARKKEKKWWWQKGVIRVLT